MYPHVHALHTHKHTHEHTHMPKYAINTNEIHHTLKNTTLTYNTLCTV